MQENKPILVVGLGNPGKAYDNTRHNAGFMSADALAGPDATWKSEHKSLVAKVSDLHSARSILIAKPQTFMNLSGIAVQGIMAFYKIPLENLVVIHDDMDIKLGEIREKTGGGSAGHNGIKSIDSAIGPEYKRIRIGVGHPQIAEMDPSDWVLSKFTQEELKVIEDVIKNIKI